MTQLQIDVRTIAANLQNASNAVIFMENISENARAVEQDIQNAYTASQRGNWKLVGLSIGNFSRLVLLHVNSLKMQDIDFSLVGKDIVLFVEGFADGLTNTDIEDPLETCWNDATISLNELETAIQDFKHNTKESILAGIKSLSAA